MESSFCGMDKGSFSVSICRGYYFQAAPTLISIKYSSWATRRTFLLLCLLQGYQISTNHLLDTGAVFVRSLLQLDHSEVENEYDDRELYEYSTKLQCKTSVEKDNSMKITRYILKIQVVEYVFND